MLVDFLILSVATIVIIFMLGLMYLFIGFSVDYVIDNYEYWSKSF